MPAAAAWSKKQTPSNCSRLALACCPSASSVTHAPAELPFASPTRYAHHRSSLRESLPYRSPAESQASGRSSLLEFRCFSTRVLLRDVGFGQAHSKLPDTCDYADSFGHRDSAACIQQIKKM